MKTRLFISTVYISSLTLIIAPVFAQTPPATQLPPAAQKPVPPKTLEEGLNAARWDATKRGVLIALDPQAPLNRLDAMKADASALVQGRDGYEADSLAAYFKRIAHRFGGVTVLAPANMVEINPRPGPPEFEKEDADKKKIKTLLATFTTEQWKMVGSQNGIGMAEMRAAQQKIYDSMLDNPFVVARMTSHDYVVRNYPALRKALDAAPKRVLTSEERAAIRFRIKMESTVHPYFEDNRETDPLVFGSNLNPDEPHWMNVSGAVTGKDKPEEYGVSRLEKYTFGVPFSREVPNHLKPSALNFDSLTAVLPLDTPDNKPLTLGDLITRVGESNHVSLLCDKRIADVHVWVRGSSAVSRDLMKSLCLGVCGAVRKVGDTYLLTSDLQGLATRRAVVDDWYLRVRQAQLKEDELISLKISRSNAEQYIMLYENDLIKPSSAQMQKMLAKTDYRDGIFGIVMKRSEFSPEAIVALDRGEKRWKPAKERDLPSTTTSYVANVTPWMGFIVPGVGEIEGEYVSASLKPFSPKPAPLTAKDNLILLKPSSESEAELAVNGLAERGAKGVFITTTITPTGEAILKAAITAGQKAKLPVYAALHLMRKETTNAPTALLDCNILGQTSDWLAPDLPETKSLLVTAMARLAKNPGLAGIVLLDIFPPGYRGRMAHPTDGNLTPFVAKTVYAEQGYRFQHRTQFLQETGVDPIDIVPYFESEMIRVPFFPNPNQDKLADTWAAWRNDRALPLVKTVRTTIETAHPGLPVLLQGELIDYALSPLYFRWYVNWTDSEPLPRIFRNDATPFKPLAPQVRDKAKQFFVVRYGSPKEPDLEPFSPDPTGADGTVIDLSADSVKDALEKLEVPKGIAQGNNP